MIINRNYRVYTWFRHADVMCPLFFFFRLVSAGRTDAHRFRLVGGEIAATGGRRI